MIQTRFISYFLFLAFILFLFGVYILKKEEICIRCWNSVLYVTKDTDYHILILQKISQEQPNQTTIIKQPLPSIGQVPPHFDFSTLLQYLQFQFEVISPTHLNFIIRDPNSTRWEVPEQDPFPRTNRKTANNSNVSLLFEFSLKEPNKVQIIRKSTQEVIFELLDPLIFSDRYIEFWFQLPTNKFHGFGERIYDFDFKPGTFTQFMLDRIGQIEKGKIGYNAHGHHPMYIIQEKSGLWHINYLRNFNGQEFTLFENNTIKYQMIGGVIDFHFFLGNSPEEVVHIYHEYMGGWQPPAFWAMGKHQCKWDGYDTPEVLEEVMRRYTENDLPLDTLWSDIEIATKGQNLYPNAKSFPRDKMVSIFAKYKKRWIPVIDPWFSSNPDWGGYTCEYPTSLELAYHRMDGTVDEADFIGKMHFIDFWHPRTERFWLMMLERMNNFFPMDGVWLDENEYSKNRRNFTSGKYYSPSVVPFWPGGENWYNINIPLPDDLYFNNLEEMDGRGTQNLLQLKATHKYFRLKKGKSFPFVLSRANSPGTGKYGAHFIPDYKSDWPALRVSISSIFNFNLFGVVFSGGDLCGVGGEPRTEPELCARWYQLGVFYPFLRNHHMFQKNENNFQEPYMYEGVYFQTMQLALKLRYKMLKYYYSLMFSMPGGVTTYDDNEQEALDDSNVISVKFGMVYKPIRFVFHTDETLPPYGNDLLMTQFMVGDGIMVAPSVYPNETVREVYFPQGVWYDLREVRLVEGYKGGQGYEGRIKNIDVRMPCLAPWFLRGGFIYFDQDAKTVLRTEDLDNVFRLYVGLGVDTAGKGIAKGKIMNIQDYNNEEDVWKKCVRQDCIREFEAEYDRKINRMKFVMKGGEEGETVWIEIKSIVVMFWEKGMIRPEGKIFQDGKYVGGEEFKMRAVSESAVEIEFVKSFTMKNHVPIEVQFEQLAQ